MDGRLFSTQGISLERMQNFCRVAETESFTVAADGDPNRQTLYSRQVKDLERFFGTELFVRRGRTVVLSDSGRQLHALLSEYFSALEDFRELCSDSVQSVTIGGGDSFIQWSMIPKLGELRDFFGRAELNLVNLRTEVIVSELKKGSLDFGIIRKDAVESELATLDLGQLNFSLFVPSKTGLNTQSAVARMSDLRFAGMEGQGMYQRAIQGIAEKDGLLMRFEIFCSSFPMMAKAMIASQLSGILPSSAVVDLKGHGYSRIELDSLSDLSRSMCLCWNRRLERVNPNTYLGVNQLASLLKF